ncbi:metallophosphoesterase family protein [Methylobacterium frigidaeris]|uniref:3',5'-cyclic adenosine monophosphate phosphodiesterase CpdA n=1 Tax=Methylobacterium frigidaeris TaxID=2038277 RepID=A0AA37HHB3_9HYPH|nr:metallophosphoesterase family protein [Methylobacterium frigidaeris]GJD65788.1 3',5'-cyclic adenosine monophosphate phosphodiesterase CpdA [Methylobacterium frigidaeris]
MTARLWVLSDLHLDVHPLDLEPPEYDVAVIAGDVGERLCDRVLPWLRGLSQRGPVVYVPGNHDYWRSTYQDVLPEARELAAAAGVTLLAEGETAVLAGVRFVGATLWTDWDLEPTVRAAAQSDACEQRGGMQDVRRIKWRRGPGLYSKFLPRYSGELHRQQRHRIEAALAVPFAGPTVVVTHHAPHPASLRGGAWQTPLDAAYASDLTEILEGPNAPDLWVHGHIHEPRDYRVGGTRVVANPRGYVEEIAATRGRPARLKPENPSFNPALVLEV